MRSPTVRTKEFRLKGERRGYFPTLELVSVYSLLASTIIHSFPDVLGGTISTRGIDIRLPIFSARTSSGGMAQIRPGGGKVNLLRTRTDADVGRKRDDAREGRGKRGWRG